MSTPSVLFVCVKNAGKSQLAAALARRYAGDRLDVHSAGTRPDQTLNAEVVAVLDEIGVSTQDEHPKAVDVALLERVDLVVLLGPEAVLDQPTATPVRRWVTDEPSARGITGAERMRLVRDDIDRRVQQLVDELTADATG